MKPTRLREKNRKISENKNLPKPQKYAKGREVFHVSGVALEVQ
jgi:hypothetical protein